MLQYRLSLEQDDNGTILVTSPDLPIVTFGEDEDTAIKHAVDAVETVLSGMIESRLDIPWPKTVDRTDLHVTMPLQTELKVQLYRALNATGMTRAELQRRLGWKRESVDRLFRLGHNSRIEQLDQAFRAIGLTVGVEIQKAA